MHSTEKYHYNICKLNCATLDKSHYFYEMLINIKKNYMTNPVTLLFSSFIGFLQIYLILLLVRVSLTWFPNVNWYGQPFYSLSRLTDPYLKMFRGIVPPLVGIDISPILGFILLQCIMQIVSNVGLTTN